MSNLTYRSFCSGIGAPETAWTPLGWECLSTSEIDPQAAAVLAHHHNAPNLGNMEQIGDAGYADVFVAGTPCQSFSVAGLRAGMADPRGNLALVFLGLVDRARPRWVVWENVPGVLSSNGGKDFGAFIGGLAECGYGFAYRILDAQFVRVDSHPRAVPQRRRRVFVIGYLGDWRCAAAVLLERESMCGHPAPGRQAGEGTAKALKTCSGGIDREDGHTLIPAVSPALKARDCKGPSSDGDGDGAPLIAHALTASGFDASEDGTGRGTPLGCGTIVAFSADYSNQGIEEGFAPTMGTKCLAVSQQSSVRRLTPVECERLQGFPDGYTQVTYKGKPRYRMLGNSMPVNVMGWIGERIQNVDIQQVRRTDGR